MTTIEPMPPVPMPAQSNASGARAATSPFSEWLRSTGAFARNGGSQASVQDMHTMSQAVDTTAEALALLLSADETAALPHAQTVSLAPAGDAQTTMDPSSILVEMRGARGEQEILALPWRLAASGRLDHRLIFSDLGVAATAVASVASVDGAQIGIPGTTTAPMGHARTSASADDLRLAHAPLAVARLSAESQRRTAVAMGDPQTAAGAPVAAEWLQRWTRWIERDGRDPAVWLRDYRLDADGVRRMVETLHAFAREHGFALERIVVNGREQWRAETTRADASPSSHSNQE